MKMAKIVISALSITMLLGSAAVFSDENNDTISAHYLFHFLDKEKFVWLTFHEELGAPVIDGNFKKVSFYFPPEERHIIIGEGTIIYGETNITVTKDDIIINEQPMNMETVVTIDNNKVEMGVYIRSFE
jgi:hypothetical protein